MKSSLEKTRHTKFVGVAELAGEVARILSESGMAQARGTVTEVPDERTIRYYLAEGLLSPAEEKQGTASVFNHRHLLQLLVVKKLQSEHLPIRKIRELVAGRTERELERLLGAEGGAAVKNEALSYLEKLLTTSPPVPQRPPSTPALPRSSVAAAPTHSTLIASPGSSISGGSGTWSRIEIEPGLELHIHDQYQPPREARGLRKLTQKLLGVIESFGQKTGKRGS